LTRGAPYYTPEGTPDKMRGDGTRRTPRGAARGADLALAPGLALALGLALLATCAPPAAAQGGPPGDADGGITVAAAAAAKAPPRGAPAAQDCALPGWVFLPGVQQATWRGRPPSLRPPDPRSSSIMSRSSSAVDAGSSNSVPPGPGARGRSPRGGLRGPRGTPLTERGEATARFAARSGHRAPAACRRGPGNHLLTGVLVAGGEVVTHGGRVAAPI
jgi:hypothetical protein